MSNRKLFIGCSRAALELADYIETKLKTKFKNLEIVTWDNKANWTNAKSTLENLVNATNEFYYGIFIFFPDDFINVKGKDFWITRDNVIFEAGLFFSKFGGERTFILKPYLLGNHPVNNEFRVLNDFDGIEFTSYKIDYDIAAKKWAIDKGDGHTKTNIEQIFKDISKKENELNLPLVNVSNEIERLSNLLSSELRRKGENAEYYLSIFFKYFEELGRLKSIQIGKPLEHLLNDIVISVNKLNDILDIGQLADEQSKSKNPKLGSVWVFADNPLEFKTITADDPLKSYFDKLRATIKDNLRQGVKYVYFVNQNFDFGNLNALVANDRDLLKNIEVIKCDKKHFLTFFTLHFETHQNSPYDIFVSFIDKRRNDLLIKIPTESQAADIHRNLKIIKGNSEINTSSYTVFDRTHGHN